MQTTVTTLTPANVIERLRGLPPMPAVVADLLITIEQPDVAIDIIANKVACDQAIAAKALRLANSSFFGLRHRAVTMHDVVTVLGLRAVRTLVAAVAVVGHLRPAVRSKFDFEAFWRHSIGTAVAAGLLARKVRADQDAAFMAGLLHDIGRLVLVTCFPAQYDEVLLHRSEHENSLAAERATLGLDHVSIGVELARHWNFPLLITDAIAGHHDNAAEGPISLAELIRAADTAAHSLGYLDDVDGLVEPAIEARLARLGITELDYENLLTQTREQVDGISEILVSSRT